MKLNLGGCGEKEPLCIVGVNVNWCTAMENNMEVHEKLKNRTTIWFSDSTPRPLPGENHKIQKDT